MSRKKTSLFTKFIVGVAAIVAISALLRTKEEPTVAPAPIGTVAKPVPAVAKPSPSVVNVQSTPTPAPTPVPLDFALLSGLRDQWPIAVTTKVAHSVPLVIDGQATGQLDIPAGSTVHLKRVRSDATLELSQGKTDFTLNAADTDFEESIRGIQDAQEQGRKMAEKRRAEDAANAKQEAEIKQAAFNLVVGPSPTVINSTSWPGGCREVETYFKATLKDPKSFEAIEWGGPDLVKVEGEPYWRVFVKYRAKNSFGGYVVEQGYALIQRNQVVRYTPLGQ